VINKGQIVAQDTIERLTTRMRQGLLYQMNVKAPSERGISAMKAIPGVKDVVIHGSGLQIEILPEQSELRDRLIEVAVQEKMGVLEFTAEKLSLEEVFLQLTTQEHPA
jgi:ABC-type uncharacterized transport system ATPase subunit